MESTREEEAAADQDQADLSYPPFFLQSNASLHRRTPNSGSPSPCERVVGFSAVDVPVVDLGRLDPAGMAEACRDLGLFRVVNHGIPAALSAGIHGQAKALLSLPFASKAARFSRPGVAYFWGTPALTLAVKDVNWLEGLHIPLALLLSGRSAADFEGFEAFRSLVDEYGQHMARIARTLFDVIADNLKLDTGLRSSYLSEYDGTFRVYRYPKCAANDASSDHYFAMEPHTDSSVLSILNQDDVGGLQILGDGRWFDVQPIADTLIVNLGDITQAISDDEYKSVEHRVVVNSGRERVSLCYFGFPVDDCLISSSRYRQFSYKEFKDKVQEDIEVSGAKVGLRRFKMDDDVQAED